MPGDKGSLHSMHDGRSLNLQMYGTVMFLHGNDTQLYCLGWFHRLARMDTDQESASPG